MRHAIFFIKIVSLDLILTLLEMILNDLFSFKKALCPISRYFTDESLANFRCEFNERMKW